MLDINQISEAILGWVEEATGLSCIYADGAGPRPTGEYLTIKIVTAIPWGDGEFEATANPDFSVTLDHSIIQDMMVSINAYRGSALTTISKLISSLDHVLTQDLLGAAGIGIGSASDIREIAEIIGKKWEDRAQVDLHFNVRSYSNETIEGIKQVEITNEIDGTTTIIKHPDLV